MTDKLKRINNNYGKFLYQIVNDVKKAQFVFA